MADWNCLFGPACCDSPTTPGLTFCDGQNGRFNCDEDFGEVFPAYAVGEWNSTCDNICDPAWTWSIDTQATRIGTNRFRVLDCDLNEIINVDANNGSFEWLNTFQPSTRVFANGPFDTSHIPVPEEGIANIGICPEAYEITRVWEWTINNRTPASFPPGFQWHHAVMRGERKTSNQERDAFSILWAFPYDFDPDYFPDYPFAMLQLWKHDLSFERFFIPHASDIDVEHTVRIWPQLPLTTAATQDWSIEWKINNQTALLVENFPLVMRYCDRLWMSFSGAVDGDFRQRVSTSFDNVRVAIEPHPNLP